MIMTLGRLKRRQHHMLKTYLTIGGGEWCPIEVKSLSHVVIVVCCMLSFIARSWCFSRVNLLWYCTYRYIITYVVLVHFLTNGKVNALRSLPQKRWLLLLLFGQRRKRKDIKRVGSHSTHRIRKKRNTPAKLDTEH